MTLPNTYQEALELNNQSSVLISTWILVGASTVCVLARGAVRSKSVGLQASDVLLPFALVCALAQAVCIQFAVKNGLGRTVGVLGEAAFEKYNELTYWSELLYVLVLGITQTSFAFLPLLLRPRKVLRVGCYSISATVLATTVALLLTAAFQCALPQPWLADSGKCINLRFFWKAAAIINITIDILVLTLPLTTIQLMSVASTTRAVSDLLCLTRLLVPACIVVQMIYVNRLDRSTNPTYDGVPLQICVQLTLNLSIMTACLPVAAGIFSDRFITSVPSMSMYSSESGDDGLRRSNTLRRLKEGGHIRLTSVPDVPPHIGELIGVEPLGARWADRISWFSFRRSMTVASVNDARRVESWCRAQQQIEAIQENEVSYLSDSTDGGRYRRSTSGRRKRVHSYWPTRVASKRADHQHKPSTGNSQKVLPVKPEPLVTTSHDSKQTFPYRSRLDTAHDGHGADVALAPVAISHPAFVSTSTPVVPSRTSSILGRRTTCLPTPGTGHSGEGGGGRKWRRTLSNGTMPHMSASMGNLRSHHLSKNHDMEALEEARRKQLELKRATSHVDLICSRPDHLTVGGELIAVELKPYRKRSQSHGSNYGPPAWRQQQHHPSINNSNLHVQYNKMVSNGTNIIPCMTALPRRSDEYAVDIDLAIDGGIGSATDTTITNNNNNSTFKHPDPQVTPTTKTKTTTTATTTTTTTFQNPILLLENGTLKATGRSSWL